MIVAGTFVFAEDEIEAKEVKTYTISQKYPDCVSATFISHEDALEAAILIRDAIERKGHALKTPRPLR